jgi:UDP-N-acetylglucosamine 2-epimerase
MIKNSRIKVMTIIGTRPEIIRLSRVMARLDEFVNHVIVHTGQNYDYELNEIFFKDLSIRKPDYFLNIDTSSLGVAVGDIIGKSEKVMIKEKPDALLVLGDTNSCLSAYMAKRLHIPVFHMEAGNRCFDENVPEETNRRIIDHIADFNLVYTENARRHLISEGLPHRRIYFTGSPMKEIIDFYRPNIEKSKILEELKLKERRYFVVSVHREENVDNPDNLKQIINVLSRIYDFYRFPLIVSTHPRTRKRIEENKNKSTNKDIRFLKPFNFTDYLYLQTHATCTISDSGTISEESAILSFPAISIRQSMERPEAQDAGTIFLTGFNEKVVLSCIETAIEEHKKRKYVNNIPDYSITDTSWRVLKLIMGNAGLSNKWHGISR